MNPYTVVPPRISQGLKDWQSLLPEPLSGDQPLRTARLMLAAAVLSDMPEASLDASADFLRETALIRRVEWQQRLQFLSLLPRERPCERVLLALFMLTELTAAAAQRKGVDGGYVGHDAEGGPAAARPRTRRKPNAWLPPMSARTRT